MIIKGLLIWAILVFGIFNQSFAQELQRILDLRGNWRFSIGDNLKWSLPDYQDQYWEQLRVPGAWEDQGFHRYDGYAWYRKTFRLPTQADTDRLYLVLGYIDDVDEVYVNGVLIGGSGMFPPHFSTAYKAQRIYYVPAKVLLKNQDNLVAVRVYDRYVNGGIIDGDIGLYNAPQGKVDQLDLSGLWKFHLGDDSRWAAKDWDDRGWRQMKVPGNWEKQGEYKYNGFAWYRKQFYCPTDLNGSLLLVMGYIDDYDEVYVNGRLVGSTGRQDMDRSPRGTVNNWAWQVLRKYEVPNGLIKVGEVNTIAVRVYDGMVDGGIYEGPVKLQRK